MINFDSCVPIIKERLKAHGIIFPYMGLRRSRPKGWKTIIIFTKYGNDKSVINPSFEFLSKEIDIRGLESFSMVNWALKATEVQDITSEQVLVDKVVTDILKMKEERNYA